MAIIYNGKFEKDEFITDCSIMESDIAIVEDLHDLVNEKDNVEINVFAVLLCTRRKSSATINDEQYDICKDDAFVCIPQTIIDKSLVSFDFEYKCICLSIDFVREIQPGMLINGWDIIKRLKVNPLVHLSENDISAFHLYYSLLKNKLANPSRKRYFRETLIHSLLAFLYEMQNNEDMNQQPVTVKQYSSAENIFNQFIMLLRSTTPKRRNVAYYASKLNITAKYLWQICHNVDGRSASDIIDAFVIEDIKYQLKYTDKSIKQISVDMDFPNISFFGRYTKKYLGVSPKAYRSNLK